MVYICLVCCVIRPYDDANEEAYCTLFVCNTDDGDMTQNQKELAKVYSLFTIVVFAVAVGWGLLYKIGYLGLQRFLYGERLLSCDVVGCAMMWCDVL